MSPERAQRRIIEEAQQGQHPQPEPEPGSGSAPRPSGPNTSMHDFAIKMSAEADLSAARLLAAGQDGLSPAQHGRLVTALAARREIDTPAPLNHGRQPFRLTSPYLQESSPGVSAGIFGYGLSAEGRTVEDVVAASRSSTRLLLQMRRDRERRTR